MRRTVQPVQPRANFVSIIAWVQFISAAITAVLMLILSVAMNAMSYFVVFGSFIWLPGLCLMCWYWLFATQCRAPASSMALWILSLVFNFPGLIIVLRYLLSDYASNRDGFEYVLVILPPLIGTVLGVLGMIAAHLESKR